MPPLNLDHTSDDGVVALTVRGELDMDSGPRLQEVLTRLESAQPERLLLDLRGVSYFDSTGVQIVLDAEVRAREAGRALIVAPGAGEPRRVLKLADALDRLTLAESDEPAR